MVRPAEHRIFSSVEHEQTHCAEIERVAHVGSWEWTIGGNHVDWSDELYRIYGLTHDQFDGTFEGFLAHVHPADREASMKVVLDGMRTLQPWFSDHRIVRPDGTVRMLHTRAEVVADAHGRPQRMIGC